MCVYILGVIMEPALSYESRINHITKTFFHLRNIARVNNTLVMC